MIEVKIFVKKIGENSFPWKGELTTNIKGKEYKKEVEGIITDVESFNEPAKVILSMIKTKQPKLTVSSNSKNVLKFFQGENIKTKIVPKLELKLSEDVLEEAKKKDFPSFLKTKLKDITQEKFLKNLAISTIFMKAYLYFNENPDKIFDFDLFKDCKEAGIIEEDTELEDIFQTIEEYFLS